MYKSKFLRIVSGMDYRWQMKLCSAFAHNFSPGKQGKRHNRRFFCCCRHCIVIDTGHVTESQSFRCRHRAHSTELSVLSSSTGGHGTELPCNTLSEQVGSRSPIVIQCEGR